MAKVPFSSTAPASAMAGPQKLATVNPKVIDILGQVGEAEIDATYIPAPSSQQSQPDTKQTTKANYHAEEYVGDGSSGIDH